MTSLSYLHTHRLHRAINSHEVEDVRSTLGLALLHLSGKSKDLCLKTARIWFKIKQIFWVQSCCSAHTHSWEGVLSPVFSQQLGHVSCSFCADCCQYSPGLDWRANGRALFHPAPLIHTHTHTHASHSLAPYHNLSHHCWAPNLDPDTYIKAVGPYKYDGPPGVGPHIKTSHHVFMLCKAGYPRCDCRSSGRWEAALRSEYVVSVCVWMEWEPVVPTTLSFMG